MLFTFREQNERGGGTVGLADCTGEIHEFYFRTHLLGSAVALYAFELRDGHPAGYQFQITS
jgi:hypothetical protein